MLQVAVVHVLKCTLKLWQSRRAADDRRRLMSEVTKVIGAGAADLSAVVALLTYLGDSKASRGPGRASSALPVVSAPKRDGVKCAKRSKCGDIPANAVCIEIDSK